MKVVREIKYVSGEFERLNFKFQIECIINFVNHDYFTLDATIGQWRIDNEMPESGNESEMNPRNLATFKNQTLPNVSQVRNQPLATCGKTALVNHLING